MAIVKMIGRMTPKEIEKLAIELNDFVFTDSREGVTREFFDDKAICFEDQLLIMEKSIRMMTGHLLLIMEKSIRMMTGHPQ